MKMQPINPDIQSAPLFPSENSIENRNRRNIDSENIAIVDDEFDLESDNQYDNPSNVTEEDMAAFESDELSTDGVDDEQLRKRTNPVNFSGDDLDIPGAELDDDMEEIGSEDEENNSYSLGGDNHNDLEEDHT
jgi:hypothetical protein